MFYEDLSIESCVDELKAVRDDMKILKKKLWIIICSL